LNKITIQNNYTLLPIDDLLDWLNGVQYFSQIDLKFGYYEIHITDKDVEKSAMRTKYSSYEFLVMPLGLCNAMSMFTTLMNSIFHKKMDEFMIIYIDDTLMYFKITKECETFKICFKQAPIE